MDKLDKQKIKKINIPDYTIGITLGTGKIIINIRFIRKSKSCKK